MNPRTAVILAGLALVVGVVGLVIGISAKNGNKSDEDISRGRSRPQLEQQLGTTASQVQGVRSRPRAPRRPRRPPASTSSCARCSTSVNAIQTSVNTLNTTTATQATDIKNLQNDVNKLDTRVSNLGG